MKFNKQVCLMILIFTSIIALGGLSSANTYVSEISFSLPDSVYITNENISFIGTISQANYSTNGSLVSSSALTSNSSVNVTIQNTAESIVVEGQAQKTIGDQVLYVSNITVNGSLMNSSLSVIERFNCTTGNNGKCSISVTAPSTYGQYFVELDNFKAFTSVYFVPFKYTLSLKDELGKSPNSMFALGEQACVEVSIINASSTESYSFSGYVIDSSGNVVSVINSTTLNSNNSFTNIFTFTVDALTKTSSNSGFEYEYSTFPTLLIVTLALYALYE